MVDVALPGAVVGGLPLNFTFTPSDQKLAPTAWDEVVQTTVISKASPTDASAWAALPGATVIRPQGKVEGSEIEAIWLPFVQKREVTVATRRGEVKLAYDDQSLHILATEATLSSSRSMSTPPPGPWPRRTTYRASIPWNSLGGKPWAAGSDVGFTFSFSAADGGGVGFGGGGATKMNSLTMHPYWLPKPSNTLRWQLQP